MITEWVKNPQEITVEEYEKADEIVHRFWHQQDKTYYATVYYDAKVMVDIKVPNDWRADKIKEELKDSYYQFDIYEKEDVELVKLTGLIINGDEIKI